MKKQIVIFGATGYIGAYFTDYCIDHLPDDYEVVACARRGIDFYQKKDVTAAKVDICCQEDFERLPTENVYAIVNLTGLLPAYMKKYDPFAYVQTNISGSLRIMEYAKKAGADRALYTQTWADQAGYWGSTEVLSPSLPRKLLFTGDHAFYAITKCTVVDTMEYYREEFGIKNFVFRLPNVYMYAPESTYFVDGKEKKIGYRYMIEEAASGHDIELWGNPDAFKDILYVKDLCQMMYKALFANVNGGTYNAGTGIRTTLREQIEGMISVFAPEGSHPQIHEVPMNDSFTSFVMDIDNARSELGYEPEYTYIRYLEDYKKERERKRFDELWAGKK